MTQALLAGGRVRRPSDGPAWDGAIRARVRALRQTSVNEGAARAVLGAADAGLRRASEILWTLHGTLSGALGGNPAPGTLAVAQIRVDRALAELKAVAQGVRFEGGALLDGRAALEVAGLPSAGLLAARPLAALLNPVCEVTAFELEVSPEGRARLDGVPVPRRGDVVDARTESFSGRLVLRPDAPGVSTFWVRRSGLVFQLLPRTAPGLPAIGLPSVEPRALGVPDGPLVRLLSGEDRDLFAAPGAAAGILLSALEELSLARLFLKGFVAGAVEPAARRREVEAQNLAASGSATADLDRALGALAG